MKVPALSAVDDAEAELSRARLAQEDIEARALRRDPDVTQDDRDAAAKLVSWCEMRLEGAHNADLAAAAAVETAASAEHLAELLDGRHAERAARLVERAATSRAGNEELYAEAVAYDLDTGHHIAALGRTAHLPDGVEVERDFRGRVVVVRYGDAVWRRTPTLAADLIAAVTSELGRGTEHQPAALEPVWLALRAAHPALDVATPHTDQARVAARAVRQREADYDRRARTARTADEVVRAAYAAAKAGDGAAVHEACSSPYWPTAEAFPPGYTLLSVTADETPAEAATAAPAPSSARPRGKRAPAPTDPLPPAA